MTSLSTASLRLLSLDLSYGSHTGGCLWSPTQPGLKGDEAAGPLDAWVPPAEGQIRPVRVIPFAQTEPGPPYATRRLEGRVHTSHHRSSRLMRQC